MKRYQGIRVAAAGMFVIGVLSARAQSAAVLDAKQWSGLQYRMVGPVRGGRVTAVTGVPSQPMTFYMGRSAAVFGRPPMLATLDKSHRRTDLRRL